MERERLLYDAAPVATKGGAHGLIAVKAEAESVRTAPRPEKIDRTPEKLDIFHPHKQCPLVFAPRD